MKVDVGFAGLTALYIKGIGAPEGHLLWAPIKVHSHAEGNLPQSGIPNEQEGWHVTKGVEASVPVYKI